MPHDVRSPASQVRVASDLDELSREAADEFVKLIQQQAQGSRRFSVALTGGSTPRQLYSLLASEPYRNRIPWGCVHVFWGDERCVPPDYPESNFRMAHDVLLSQVPIPPENIHRIPTEEGDPASVATTYERTVQTFFQLREGALPEFDLVLLGLGEDGHIASLFPRAAALQETQRLVVATTGGDPYLPRVTLTVPVLNKAKQVMWLVAGKEKAPMVQTVLEGSERANDMPAQMIRPTRGVSLWFVDRAAAQFLQHA